MNSSKKGVSAHGAGGGQEENRLHADCPLWGGPILHVDNVKGKTLKGIIRENVEGDARIYTDSYPSYQGLDKKFASHETVNHGDGEYVRGDVHVNFAESYFSLLKRGVIGIFNHLSAKHLHRYLSEFDFRWNRRDVSDSERVLDTLRNLVSARLYYKMPIDAANNAMTTI